MVSVKNFINNSYAWIKLGDILISHGGLCSEYLNYIEKKNGNYEGDEIINYVNKKYRQYFSEFDYKHINNKDNDNDAIDLFITYDKNSKSTNAIKIKKRNFFFFKF